MKRFTHVFFSVFIVFVVIWSCSSDDDACEKLTWYYDYDNDGFGRTDLHQAKTACTQPEGYVSNSTDCNDLDATINPDKIWYIDADNDGFGSMDISLAVTACEQPDGYVEDNTDCDDDNDEVNPDAEEVLNDGIDNNCDGTELIIDPPTEVEITITDITVSSATVGWTEATTNVEDIEIVYDLYLDDQLLAENLAQFTFNLEGLNYNTNYIVKIDAKHFVSSTLSETNFQTSTPDAPSDFEFNAPIIEPLSCDLSWTEASTNVDIPITYSLIVNSNVIVEGLEETQYTLDSLSPDTAYEVTLIASHEFEASEIVLNFDTLPIDLPSDFDLDPPIPRATNIQLSWAEASTNVDIPITYNLFIDGELIAENLEDTEYTLTNLVPGTSYELTLQANHDYGSSEVVFNVQTLNFDQVSFYLNTVNYISNAQPFPFNNDWTITYHPNWFIYDFNEGSSFGFWDTRTEYEGDNLTYYNGFSDFDWHYFRLYMYYANNEFTSTRLINSTADADFMTEYELTYNSPLTCDVEVKHTFLTDIGYQNEFNYYNISMTKDSIGRLVSYTIVNTDTNETTSLNFEYDVNNNLNRIIRNSTDILDITYDNQPNFTGNTRNYSAFCYFGLFTSGNLPFLDLNNRNNLGQEAQDDLFASSSITDVIKVIPELYNHTNTNNVTSYILNGTTIRTLDYQYYSSGLPQQMSFDDVVVTFNYDEVLN